MIKVKECDPPQAESMAQVLDSNPTGKISRKDKIGADYRHPANIKA